MILKYIADRIQGKTPAGVKRSDKWPKVRRAFLEDHPTCAACGSKDNLECHHILAFHTHPELELESKNLVTLCESNKGINCHFVFGHLLDWKDINPSVIINAKYALAMFNRSMHR